MEPGSVVEQMNLALQRDLLILVLTPNALHSEWVHREMDAAIHRAKDGFMREPIIVVAKPFDLKEVPPLWSAYLRYDATGNYPVALAQIIHQLDRSANAPALPADTPSNPLKAEKQSRVVVELEKGQVVPIDLTKVQIEMYWGVSKEVAAAAAAVSNQEFDVDYALFICRGDVSDPKDPASIPAAISSIGQAQKMPERYENRHLFPYGSAMRTAAVIRSKDARYGGNKSAPDETGTIDFSKLPPDVVRIVVYVHIYKGSTRQITLNGEQTQQLFKHANVRFRVLDYADGSPLVSINLGQKHPENWGIVLCEFVKNSANKWEIESIEKPLDGDTIKECLEKYGLPAGGVEIRYRGLCESGRGERLSSRSRAWLRRALIPA